MKLRFCGVVVVVAADFDFDFDVVVLHVYNFTKYLCIPT